MDNSNLKFCKNAPYVSKNRSCSTLQTNENPITTTPMTSLYSALVNKKGSLRAVTTSSSQSTTLWSDLLLRAMAELRELYNPLEDQLADSPT